MKDNFHSDLKFASAQRPAFWSSRTGIALCAFIAIAAAVLILEHRAHALQWLPYALLLACPLLHLFHGHGGHRGGKQDK